LFDEGGRTLLGLNDRGEYELIGGRLEEAEQPQAALVREFREEAGLTVRPVQLVDAYRFEPVPRQSVLILVYACQLVGGELRISEEHRELAFLPVPLDSSLPLPAGYRRAIELCRSLRS
jgi:8-oxo-dGTP pyrophosphatase MutT (NUDIX family)